MRNSLSFIVAIGVLCGALGAQTTGIPFFNDYTINGAVSGSTSCTFLTFLTPTILNFQVSTSGPATAVYLMANITPCVPGATSTFTCQGTTFDLLWTPTFFFTPMPVPNAAGFTTISIGVPPLLAPYRFSTQCALFDPACAGLVLYTQAYDVILI